MSPRIVSVGAEHDNPQICLAQALTQLRENLAGDTPSLIIGFHSATKENQIIAQTLYDTFPSIPMIGCSSCQGAMTDAGIFGGEKFGLGLWSLIDEEGTYGVGFGSFAPTTSQEINEADTENHAITQDPKLSDIVSTALKDALNQADRDGEQPYLVWLHTSPGREEAVIARLNKELGGHVPIIGGSCADQGITGEWHCFGNNESGPDGISIAVFFPSLDIELTYSLQSGYSPTTHKGRVTQAVGRLISSIDNIPAAIAYNQWCGGLLQHALDQSQLTTENTPILAETSLVPLGRAIGTINTDVHNIPYYTLIHPESITHTQGLTLFAEVKEGDEILQMTGSVNSLIFRASRVVTDAIQIRQHHNKRVLGGLIIYCAGCRLTVGDEIQTVKSEIDRAIQHTPYLTAFTFGEQGCLLGGENVHGNLMISGVVFLA